jgi:hypothetical protein
LQTSARRDLNPARPLYLAEWRTRQ